MSTERKNRPDQSMSSGVVQPTSPSLDNEKSEWFGTNTNALSNKQRTDRSGDSHMKHHKHAFNNSQSLSQQDLLGGISNEDILKLTRLTASLPDDTLQQKRVKNDHKKQHSDHHDSKPSRRRHHSSNTQDNSTSITNTDDIKPSDTTRVDSSLHPKKEIIQGKVSSSTPSTSLPYNIPNYNTHYNSDESSSDNEGSRPTVDMNTMSENIPVIHAKTEAESYIEEVNQYNADLNNYRSYLSTHLSNTNPLIEDPPTQKKSKTSIFGETLSHINATMSKLQPRKGTPFHTPSNVSMDTAGRRHSFDNVSTFSDARYGVSGKESSAIEYISGEEVMFIVTADKIACYTYLFMFG
ncbi:hypothetical protein BDB01DRAFT_163306 [Pilobolus umbonatus]|nr:hypothetical protein BDB01DRAFT_163306 [Pilobolus umbonatus]